MSTSHQLTINPTLSQVSSITADGNSTKPLALPISLKPGLFSGPIAIQHPSLTPSSASGAPVVAPMTVVAERARQRCGAKRPRDTAESTADEGCADDDVYGASSMAVSALITGLRLEFDALPKAPEGIIMAGVNPGQVVNLSHMFAMHDTLMSRTSNVLESLVMHLEGLLAKGSSGQVEELLSYASKATGKHKKMRVATALTRGLEDDIKVCTMHLL
jgi:hypothetical protein